MGRLTLIAEWIPRSNDMDWLVLGVVILGLSIVATVNNLYPRKLRTQISGFLAPRHIDQLIREEGGLNQSANLLLLLNGIIMSALALYLFFEDQREIQDPLFLILLIGSLSACLMYYYIVPTLTRFYTESDPGLKEHRYMLLLVFQVLGIVLVPFIVLGALGSFWRDEFQFAAVLIIVLFFAFRFLRGFYLGISRRVSVLYIILYLCTLEILPLVVIYRWFGE